MVARMLKFVALIPMAVFVFVITLFIANLVIDEIKEFAKHHALEKKSEEIRLPIQQIEPGAIRKTSKVWI